MAEEQTTIKRLEKGELRKVLGIADIAAVGYGDLGSSIYYALGITALYALGATPIALFLAGLIFVCTALSYAEMTSTFPGSGGAAGFARRAFNDTISFLAGWGLLLDYIVTIAISAFAMGPYLSYFFSMLEQPSMQVGFTFGIVAVLYLLNFFGARQSTRVCVVLVGFTLLTQFVIILIGLFWLFDFSYIIDHMRIGVIGSDFSPSWPQFWKGTAMAMVAYTGIDSIAQLGAEAKKPQKTVPRAIMLVLAILLFMYIGISGVALSAVSPHDLGHKYISDPILGIVEALPFGSKVLGPWIALLAPAILLTAANAGLVGASRLSFTMGEFYQLPTFFYQLHKKFRTPFISLGFFGIFSCIIVWLSQGSMTYLADLYNFGAMLAFFSVHMALLTMRIKNPNIERPFRAPFNISFGKFSLPITAIIGALATFSVWLMIVFTKPHGSSLGFVWMTFGLIMFVWYRRKHGLTVTGQLEIEKVKVDEFKQVKMDHILLPCQEKGDTELIQIACELAKAHKAEVTCIHVLKIPSTVPLEIAIPNCEKDADLILGKAEAVAREFGISIKTDLVRARSFSDAILDILEEKKIDLLIIGSLGPKINPTDKGIPAELQKILKDSTCRVFICSGKVG